MIFIRTFSTRQRTITASRTLSTTTWIFALLLLVCVLGDVVSAAAVLGRRQEDGEDGAVATTTTSVTSRIATSQTGRSATATPDSNNEDDEDGNVSNINDDKSDDDKKDNEETISSRVSQQLEPTMSADEDEFDEQTRTKIYSGEGLPFDPSVTPGIAVAGVLLILSGLPFCLIGIKKKRFQIFLSTAYLCSLGVLVLIVYVMNPPVPNAVQGGYVVAITVTGLFFGGLAIVFPEVTETLGCVLGGFTLSMWFLVLKPGGLLTTTYSKLILMAAFSLAVFALAFWRVTKPYALIFSTAFSGATSIVLGVDCFTRAGLKEMWLYIWNLNEKIFPLQTNNYPHTRGMRVEIAVIVLITIFGIMSQIKLWNIIRERREQKEAVQRQMEEDTERLDEEVGRQVEEQDREERAKWEKIYGNVAEGEEVTETAGPDSGIASVADSKVTLAGEDNGGKVSPGEEIDFIETEEMRRERIKQMRRLSGRGDTRSGHTSPTSDRRISRASTSDGDKSLVEEEDQGVPILIRQHVPYIPEEGQEDAMSLATCADTIPAGGFNEDENKFEKTQVTTTEVLLESAGGSEHGGVDPAKISLPVSRSQTPAAALEEELTGVAESVEPADDDIPLPPSGARYISSVPTAEQTTSSPASLADLGSLQNHCSAIHRTYRTNEWAKHLADADAVELDDLSNSYGDEEVGPFERPVPVLMAELAEPPMPEPTKPKVVRPKLSYENSDSRKGTPVGFGVNAPALIMTTSPCATPSPPSPVAGNPGRSTQRSSSSSTAAKKTSDSILKPAIARSNSVPVSADDNVPTIQRSSTVPAVIPEDTILSENEPQVATTTRPISPGFAPPSRAPSRAMTPQVPYSATLLGKRESMLKVKPSLAASEFMSRSASPTNANYTNTASGDISLDDMTLAQRREYLQQQRELAGSTTPHPQLNPRNSYNNNYYNNNTITAGSSPSPTPPAPSLTPVPLGNIVTSPPLPTRDLAPGAKQSHLLQSWRESLRADAQLAGGAAAGGVARNVDEKARQTQREKEREKERARRESLLDERMRQPDMLAAHREAMRRLQAKASRN